MSEGGGFDFNQWAQMNLGKGGGGDQDAKVLAKLTGIPNSEGIKYYDTQGFADKTIRPGSGGGGSGFFGLGGLLASLKQLVTREPTPVHGNESMPSIAAATGGESFASGGASFSDLVGAGGGNFDWAHFSNESLGTFTPMATGGGMGAGVGAGMDLG